MHCMKTMALLATTTLYMGLMKLIIMGIDQFGEKNNSTVYITQQNYHYLIEINR